MYKSIIKPNLDIFTAFIGLLLLSPIFIIVLLLLAVANKGKPFFFQKRPGKNERIFSIIKFKSMSDAKDNNGDLLPDKNRLTAVGAFVRKTSLDELPQLINVLKGDMSLIGPRPLLINYLPFYTKREKLRHSVKPGITGLAQVSGRNNLNWDQRLEMDVNYIEKISFALDVKILIKTIKGVVIRKDVLTIPSEKYTTLDKFRRNEVES